MTSKGDSLKTNEFLRLRKLRLQQVREQSKDIAKKIRQRAKAEKLRYDSNVDKNKEKEYLQHQEKLVNRLEQLYSRSLQSVGAGHKNASEVNESEIPEKIDLSKSRGKAATALLKRKKQEKLDEQKKLLDRKLQAREVANVLSREKFAAVANNLIKSSSGKSIVDEECDQISKCNEKEVIDNIEAEKSKSDPLAKNDMGTQWEFDEIPNEWEPNIPILPINKDDSTRNSGDDKVEKCDQDQTKRRLNLFALSDEMPASLRGGISSNPEESLPLKPSLTLVSEYLQNRGLRLREPDKTQLQKNKSDDLQSIKQTLLRTRACRTGGNVFPNICHVLDEQVIPLPCWRAERNCEFCSNHSNLDAHAVCGSKDKENNKSTFNKNPILKPGFQDISLNLKNPKIYTSYKCYQGLKIPVSGKSRNTDHLSNSEDIDRTLSKKNSVTMYDHNTRDTKDMPHNVDKLVVRDQSIDEDAYSQAIREASLVDSSDKPHHVSQQEVRNRLAITRQNVDKEYRDTLAFLNSLPKEKVTRSFKTAYMDGNREEELNKKRQHKLQEEYKKIEKQSCKPHCKHSRNKILARDQNNSKSKSPVAIDIDNIVNRDFQYSWLPIPESDDNMAIHTIKDNKPGNSVKFSSVDTYHEYRSRHKHTPPTKDTDNETNRRVVEAVIIQENSNDSEDPSSETDNSSVENLQVRQDSIPISKVNKDKQLSDAERIIIYKVMESKKTKKHKVKKKSQNESNIGKNDYTDQNVGSSHKNVSKENVSDKNKANSVSFTQLKEGIYKSVSANGLSYNVMSCCTNVDLWQTSSERKPWWDNIASLYFSDDQFGERSNRDGKVTLIEKEGTGTETGIDNNNLDRTSKPCDSCKHTDSPVYTDIQPSAATSTFSFKTAVNDKSNKEIDGGYIKFVDEGEKNTGKFYVGASGFLKDDAYEVVIQLRKKEAEKNSTNSSQYINNVERINSQDNGMEENDLRQQSTAVKSLNEVIKTSKPEIHKHQNAPEKPNLLATKNDILPHEQVTIPDDKIATAEELNVVGAREENPTIEPRQTSDKGITTTFCNDFAIQDSMPKLDPISRPVASIHTQTTQNSPIRRPVLMHLSSSTSTTYMSPPEMILPRYLRKNSTESYNDTYEPNSSNIKSQNLRFTNCKNCVCRKCKRREKGLEADTPPNTTRSTDHTTDYFASEEQYKKGTKSANKRQNVRCKSQINSKHCSKHKFKRPSENGRFHIGSNYCSLSNKSRTNNLDKVNLNPVIENYVKKLLALNKEGLKAIQIVNQECSAVNTPCSSIIEVPSNIKKNKTIVCNKISLEQIKNSLQEQIIKNIKNKKSVSNCIVKSAGCQTEKNIKMLHKFNKKRTIHKVKSFNISKQFIKTNKGNRRQSTHSTVITTSPYSTSKKEKANHACSNVKNNLQIKNPRTPRYMNINKEMSNITTHSETSRDSRQSSERGTKNKLSKAKMSKGSLNYQSKAEMRRECESYPYQSHKTTTKSQPSESETSNDLRNHRKLSSPPISISTQTNQIDSEVEFMKLAENKLQNMEKIADLTEKCTKRLSNLAKVLEEVRRNKSLAYSQISTSDCTSDSDHKSDKNVQTSNNRGKAFNASAEIKTLTDALISLPTSPLEQKNHDINNAPGYVQILLDLPKPDTFKTPSPLSFSSDSNKVDDRVVMEQQGVKNRGKPPPALTRINLKNVPEGFVIPHELSTVIEVDSPVSIKYKSNATQIESKHEVAESKIVDDIHLNKDIDLRVALDTSNKLMDSMGLINIVNASGKRHNKQSTNTSEDPKVKMMDLKHFNEIMLKPFISLKDYAKQYNLDELDGQTSLNGISKDENVNEELSSLHSETSIPDVMAELLKRNLISEPFKFETTSNVNSTTVSSESTLSLLALSRACKDKKKSTMLVRHKENIGETSVSLSISSNPDLENAFQRLGMGWASSTLKKTKERLALSSSSNTSSSSIPQFKIKSFNYQDVPELSSVLNISNKEEALKQQTENDVPRNALQQTSLTNSMTVKEFLTNELASKITFSNKSNRNTVEDEFVSLCETKIPEEMKNLPQKFELNEKSTADSLQSGTNNRARTSTPVQIFKSMTYHSTSSSNTSNGLFSNADDLSSVKGTNSIKNHSTSDKDELTIPNYSLKLRKTTTECSKSN